MTFRKGSSSSERDSETERSSLLGHSRGLASTSALVSGGLLATGLLSAAQALLLVFIIGEGDDTDAFLTAYSLYAPITLVGVSMRKSIVPLLGVVGDELAFLKRASALVSRAGAIALWATAAMLLLAPLVSHFAFPGLSSDGEDIAMLTLLLLAPAAGLQIQAGSMSGILNSLRRFPFSVTLYVLAAGLAVAASAGGLLLVGILGAAIGVLIGAVALVLGHVVYLRRLGVRVHPFPRGLANRDQGRFAYYLFSGAALGGVQQLSLPIALSAVSSTDPIPGTVTSYAYAYFLVGLVLRFSSTSVALVTLPDLVESISKAGPDAARRHLFGVTPFIFLVTLPMLAAFAAFGETILNLVFGAVLSEFLIRQLYEIGLILGLMAIATTVYVVAGSLLFALGRWQSMLWVSAASLIILAAAMYALAPMGALAIAAGHAGGATASALLVLAMAFRRDLARILRGICSRTALPFLLATVFPLARGLLGSDPSIALELSFLAGASAIYLTLAIFLWPRLRSDL